MPASELRETNKRLTVAARVVWSKTHRCRINDDCVPAATCRTVERLITARREETFRQQRNAAAADRVTQGVAFDRSLHDFNVGKMCERDCSDNSYS